MRPKEKANEILDKFWLMDLVNPQISKEQAIGCSLIYVDGILSTLEDGNFYPSLGLEREIKYYQEVKQEIEKL